MLFDAPISALKKFGSSVLNIADTAEEIVAPGPCHQCKVVALKQIASDVLLAERSNITPVTPVSSPALSTTRARSRCRWRIDL